MEAIDTSIVIATCSRAALLQQALSSLLSEAASWPLPTEIVVVDDGSADDTPVLLTVLQQTSPVPFTIVQGECRGIAAARNLGVSHARGTWIASFDDDQVALPGWLRALRTLADHSGAACVSGALELQIPPSHSLADLGPRTRGVLGEHLGKHPAESAPVRGGPRPASNNVLLRRDVFNTLGGYDLSFTEGGEDADLFDRLAAAHSIWFQPSARALHITPESRLQKNNLRWTSVRLGASDARRFARRGRLRLLAAMLLRICVSAFRDVPQLAFAALTRNQRLLRDVQCSLWYSQGLLRAAMFFLGGARDSSAFLRSLDFRSRNGERQERPLP